jgi:hypothetical protein
MICLFVMLRSPKPCDPHPALGTVGKPSINRIHQGFIMFYIYVTRVIE